MMPVDDSARFGLLSRALLVVRSDSPPHRRRLLQRQLWWIWVDEGVDDGDGGGSERISLVHLIVAAYFDSSSWMKRPRLQQSVTCKTRMIDSV